mgnify:CR=1 FL=1
MPPDINENYDRYVGATPRCEPAWGGPGNDAEVPRIGASHVGGPATRYEPPIYTVLGFRINHGGRVYDYDYAAVRAGDGKWYLTGGETMQGVDWQTMARAIRPKVVGPVQVMGPVRSLFL